MNGSNGMLELASRLDMVLEERDAQYPLRDKGNTQRMHSLMDQLVTELERMPANCSVDEAAAEHVERFKDTPVFLCGYMKSGTTLLLGLLDSHDEMVVMPGDSYLTSKFTRKPGRPTNYEWEEWRRNWLKRMINATGQKPFWLFGNDLQPYADFLGYMDRWHEQLPLDRVNPVLSAVLSFYCANPRRPGRPKMWVEKTPGNEFRATGIRKLFPHAKFIHIVREPRENFASLKRLYSTRGWEWKHHEMANTMAQSLKIAERNSKGFGTESYLVIRYEELTADTHAVLQGIASFLGVDWRDTLLVPTINSMPAQANTMYTEREVVGKVRHSSNKRWHDVLDAEEKRSIRAILPEARGAGYSWDWSLQDRLYRIFQRVRLWS